MKKLLLLAIILVSMNLYAGSVIDDEVSMDAGAVTQVWYSLETGEVSSGTMMDWHLAFQNAQFDAGVLANGVLGVNVYHVENLTVDDFLTPLSSDDMDSWVQYFNSDYSWDVGAINRDKYGFVEGEDYGWGKYNMGSHAVVGDQIFVIELPGGKYYKFMIEVRQPSGIWYFKYAELGDTDGSTVVEEEIDASQYTTKNYVYFNFDTGEIDREPDNYLWDITFTKWVKLINMGGGEPTPYPVTGVKSNISVAVVQIDDETIDYSQEPNEIEYSENLTEIGDDWKELASMEPVVYDIPDRVYFIRAVSGDIYKLQFTGYTGSSQGVVSFKKEAVVASVNDAGTFEFTVYPNVIENSGIINIVTNNESNNAMNVTLSDLQGNLISQDNYNTVGFSNNTLEVQNLSAGIYFLTVRNGEFVKTEKIIVR